MKRILLVLALIALASPALAQRADDMPRPKAAPGFKLTPLTGNIPADIAAAKAQADTNNGPFACDVSLFTKLTVFNVVDQIKNCVGDVVAGGAKPFADDLKDSNDSATSVKDTTAIGCYTPALALAVAAQGTPAVKDADGKEITPARPPGPILIFQKYREFVNAGGITNCKSVVQSTIAGTVGGAL